MPSPAPRCDRRRGTLAAGRWRARERGGANPATQGGMGRERGLPRARRLGRPARPVPPPGRPHRCRPRGRDLAQGQVGRGQPGRKMSAGDAFCHTAGMAWRIARGRSCRRSRSPPRRSPDRGRDRSRCEVTVASFDAELGVRDHGVGGEVDRCRGRARGFATSCGPAPGKPWTWSNVPTFFWTSTDGATR